MAAGERFAAVGGARRVLGVSYATLWRWILEGRIHAARGPSGGWLIPRHNASQKPGTLADRLSRFAYRKLIQALESKTVEYNTPLVIVNPRNTSKTCPVCGAPLSYQHRLALCPRRGYKADRDAVGAMNIYKRALQALSPQPRVQAGGWQER